MSRRERDLCNALCLNTSYARHDVWGDHFATRAPVTSDAHVERAYGRLPRSTTADLRIGVWVVKSA